MTAAVGIDPGGVSTGLVVRHRDELVTMTTVTREGRDYVPYLAEVLAVVDDFWSVAAGRVFGDPLVAVEGLNPPSPHMGTTSVRGLIDTAVVLGAVIARYPDAVVVPPGGHGSGPLAAYPPPLRPTRGQGKGRDLLRHCRSAFDIAGAAKGIVKLTHGQSYAILGKGRQRSDR